MYLLFKPTIRQIDQFLAAQAELPFSYREVGATQNTLPPGYVVDHNRICLGKGIETFELAKAAMRRWEMFHLHWLQLCWPDAPITVGATVAVLVRTLGLWSLNSCRIVYIIEEEGDIDRFGFAYGTLPDHAECGEERFCLEWRREDESVWYDILAFSRPRQILARLGYPYARRLQKRFAADSKQAMMKAAKYNNELLKGTNDHF